MRLHDQVHMTFLIARSSAFSQRIFSSLNLSRSRYYSSMDLKDVVKKLHEFAPLQLAEDWDNVGLLVEPSPPHFVKSLLLTNDLTEKVVQEAIEEDVNMVISYHPPIFKPLKRLTSKSFKERIIVKMIENKIAVYSPHTAFDAVKNGVNDWLASGLGSAEVEPLQCSKGSGSCRYKVVTGIDKVLTNQVADSTSKLQDSLKRLNGVDRTEVEAATK